MYDITKGIILFVWEEGTCRRIMVRVSGVRVRRGGNRRVRKNGQTMNQFVQVTQLKITSSHS